MKHALVVGGSGMLAQVSLRLAALGMHVSVIGRDPVKLDRLAAADNRIMPLSVNYYDEFNLRNTVRSSIERYGRYETVVAWLHDRHAAILGLIASENNVAGEAPWFLHHVLGSREDAGRIRAEIERIGGFTYCQVQLGFVIDGPHSRWLTHDEIADGVNRSITAQQPYALVGTLTPDDRRPY